MEQLSGLDASMLEMEKGNVYNHVAMMAIYDPSTSSTGKVRFKDILNHVKSRLGISKVFNRRLVTLPHGIDRPYWIEDAEIDIEFHIRHIALPHPGDWRQLMIQVARLHARPLDRSRPLWEMYVIEGLDNIPDLPAGSFAMFIKFHHAALDGASVARVIKMLHSEQAEAAAVESMTDKGPAQVAEREPNPVELYSLAIAHSLERLVGMSAITVKTAMDFTGMALGTITKTAKPEEGSAKPDQLSMLTDRPTVPQTRFNQPVSANRVVDAVALPFEAIKKIRAQLPGITMNDIFLAVSGGALRTYLQSKGELPTESLRALMPINIRPAGAEAKGGNEVAGAPVPLHTEIADPLQRLRAVHQGAESGKAFSEMLGADTVTNIYNQFPFFVSNFVMQNMVISQANCTVSNVRGPEGPLFLAGARMVHAYPVSIPVDGLGLNLTGFSYNGVLWICTVACRNMMPDPAFFAQCLRDSFAELSAAALRQAQESTLAMPAVAGKATTGPHLRQVAKT